MSREKQIEEMAQDLCQAEFWDVDEDCCDLELDRRKTAENLYNAGYRKQEWISVDERLPEKHQDVLVYRDGYVTSDFVCSEGRFILEDVTHWMPLPEPPKGDAE